MEARPAVGQLRPWSEGDDVAALTELLHIAYKPLLDAGVHYLAATQDEGTTLRRIGGGRHCWVIADPEVLATVTLTPQHLTRGCDWYDRPGVASIGQVAVHPAWQRHGLGRVLVEHAERTAAAGGADEVAVDTSERAHHLIHWYERQGYRPVGSADWDVTNYRSIVLSKGVSRVRE